MIKRVLEHLNESKSAAFSFEVLPPLKGGGIGRVYETVDKLLEFGPKFINITSHHSEHVEMPAEGGAVRKVAVRRRPGSVAIAAAIQAKYGVTAVPHIICNGFTKEETEYALIDLDFLGVRDLLLLRGDDKEITGSPDKSLYHRHAVELQKQVNDFNCGVALDGSAFEGAAAPFSYGVAGYPEKHEEAPNMESDIRCAKEKIDAGAGYVVTQMFFDNAKFHAFVERMRAAGVRAPIIPGLKPITRKSQLTVLPKVFRAEIPEALASELRKCKDDVAAREIGVEWCVGQCRDLMRRNIPDIHFYTLFAAESVRRIAQALY